MGAGDGPGTATPAPDAVNQFNFRRTPITSGSEYQFVNRNYWAEKEAEFNNLHPSAQAQFSNPAMRPVSLLENDWNHLVDIPLQGLESTPFRELVCAYPKNEEAYEGLFAAGPQQLIPIRKMYGDQSIGAFTDGPVFPNTHVDISMFDRLICQASRLPRINSVDPSRDMHYMTRIMKELHVGSGSMTESEDVVLPPPGLSKVDPPLEHVVQPPPLMAFTRPEYYIRGPEFFLPHPDMMFDCRLEVGHFMPPAIQHSPQQRGNGRQVIHTSNPDYYHRNPQIQQARNQNQHCPQHQSPHGRRAGSINNHRGNSNRGNQAKKMSLAQANQLAARQRVQDATRATSSASQSSSPPANQEHRRETVVPIQVVVVDRQNGEGSSSGSTDGDSTGSNHNGNGYRQWRGKRFTQGKSNGSTPNKIHFNRNL